MFTYSHMKNIIVFIKNKFLAHTNPFCRIEELDLNNKIITIHFRGINAQIKLTFDEIINDSVILSNLAPQQASWIGYYYGKHYSDLINKNSNYANFFDFSIDDQDEIFHILMINRHGHIIYSNKDNNKTNTISPTDAIKNENIINKFSSIQACYIGILAGTASNKISEKKTSTLISNTHLKLVK